MNITPFIISDAQLKPPVSVDSSKVVFDEPTFVNEKLCKTSNINGYKISHYGNNTIFVIENILKNEICDELIELIDKIPKELQLCNNDNKNVECYFSYLNDCIDNDDSLFYKFNTDCVTHKVQLDNANKNIISYFNKNNGIAKDDIIKYILLFDNISKILENIFININPRISFKFNSGLILRQIFGATRQHIDDIFYDKSFNKVFIQQNRESREINMNAMIIRNASAIFSLNDNYDGGVFNFPDMNFELKLKKGSVLIFPPYWTHKHETTELLNNTHRYTVTTWYGKQMI